MASPLLTFKRSQQRNSTQKQSKTKNLKCSDILSEGSCRLQLGYHYPTKQLSSEENSSLGLYTVIRGYNFS